MTREVRMKNDKLNGSALAVAAVSLVLAGAVTPVAAAITAKVQLPWREQLQGKIGLSFAKEYMQRHERVQSAGVGVQRNREGL